MRARREKLENLPFDPERRGHPGLWMDKFLEKQTQSGNGGDKTSAGSKSKLLAEVARSLVPERYAETFEARKALLARDASRTVVATATARGRMIIGLGAKGPAEVGLRLEHTWGVPVLPGSALKGLAASAAHRLVKKDGWHKPGMDESRARNDFDTLFGTTDDQGKVTFHDAWWIPEKASKLLLDLDVMTVHHSDYYAGKKQRDGQVSPPSDTDSPYPVSFVSARGSFLVVLEGEPEWTEAAYLLLEVGLDELGLGAKTNAGYGRMTLSRAATAGPPRGPLGVRAELTFDPSRREWRGTATVGGRPAALSGPADVVPEQLRTNKGRKAVVTCVIEHLGGKNYRIVSARGDER